MNKEENIEIVGFGLAGAVMAWQLYFKGRSFKIYDSTENHSTRTAAGLVNPIVFKRLTKSWMADHLLPYASEFYNKIEEHLDQQLLSNRSIVRIFSGIEEQNNWSLKCGDERFKPYMEEITDFDIKGIDSPFGAGKVNTIGNLNTKKFLDDSKAFFLKKGIQFVNNKFDYYEIDEKKTFIFCEGYEIKDNFFFNYLPMKPTQGETLTIKTEELYFEDILNKNMFVLPLGDNLYKVGATYNWEIQDTELLIGKQELKDKLAHFSNFEYEIVNHESGIRPTVSDRRPLIGCHPEHDNMYVFNGLGTKGVMIAPYFSAQLIDLIIDGSPINSEVNIERYLKFYNA